MATSVIVWQCITIFCYIFQPVCTGTTHTSKACFGNHGVSCALHNISCSIDQKIAIYDAYYTNITECRITGVASCTNARFNSLTEHGYQRLNNTELVSLYKHCSTETRCVYPAPRRSNAGLAFSVVKYKCIEKADSLSIRGGSAQGLSFVSITHNQTMHSSTIQSNNYKCSFMSNVTATSISVYAIDARLRRETQGQCFSRLSVLPENVITRNTCSSVFQPFERLKVTAELPASLNLMDIPRSSTLIWLLINASGTFNVKCETQTMTRTEQSGGDTGAIIGGVVATVLAVLVVSLVSVVLIRKRQVKSVEKKKNASFPLDVKSDTTYSLAGKISQNNYHDIQDMKTQSSDYDYATADGLAVPPKAQTYFTIEPAGKQNTKQFSKASTTENDYDHIGDKTSPQTSDYDTTASVAQAAHTGGTVGEDDYGYNLFHKESNPQTHQNDYDTAASATKAVAQLTRTDRNTDDDDYDHFPSVTNDLETVSSPYDTASTDYSVAGPMK